MDLEKIYNRDVCDREGSKLGKVEEIYLNDKTNKPQWIAIKGGLFGSKHRLVPMQGAHMEGDILHTSYAKDQIEGAPDINLAEHLDQEGEQQLMQHYQLDGSEKRADHDSSAEPRERAERSGDRAMTRSEEEMLVGTQAQETGRARLRKYVVTEEVTTTVPLRKEKLVLERDPITEENRGAAMEGANIAEDTHEVTLMEEEAVTGKRIVPKERVRLGKDAHTVQQPVFGEVRKEEMELDKNEPSKDTE